ncbi:MAG TPA: hypothetical protein VIW45_16205 [Vicinamibacterales bacterium]
MRRFAYACALATIAALAAGSRSTVGQERGNPFIDHSDTGETIHVLPPPAAIRSPRDTAPTDAPAHKGLSVFPASYGSGNLIDHGGREISLAGFFAIYWNGSVANSAGTQGNADLRSTVQNFILDYSDGQPYSQTDPSADYSIVQQYGSTDAIDATLAWAGDFVDNRATKPTISDSNVRSYIAGLFSSGTLVADEHTIFGVYFPSGMKISTQGGTSCSAFCGYHGHFSYNGLDIKYAVFPYTDCRACSVSGKNVADILTIVSSHEIREAVTDPDLNAWFDAPGYEADDKCAWHNLYQTVRGNFWVQPEYSNGDGVTYPGPGCVVPR